MGSDVFAAFEIAKLTHTYIASTRYAQPTEAIARPFAPFGRG